MAKQLAVYLEQARRRTFAGALDWPGWTRAGRTPDEALQSLLEYQPRYPQVAARAGLDFDAAAEVDLDVVEKLFGDADTDRGSPTRAPSVDSRPVTDRDLRWFKDLLRACWQTFDAAVELVSCCFRRVAWHVLDHAWEIEDRSGALVQAP